MAWTYRIEYYECNNPKNAKIKSEADGNLVYQFISSGLFSLLLIVAFILYIKKRRKT